MNLTFNGDKLGIYAIEEHFSKELLESQGRREGVIVRFNETALWGSAGINVERTVPGKDVFFDNPDGACFEQICS